MNRSIPLPVEGNGSCQRRTMNCFCRRSRATMAPMRRCSPTHRSVVQPTFSWLPAVLGLGEESHFEDGDWGWQQEDD